MARISTAIEETVVNRRYRHDLAEWKAHQQHQARLRRLAARALDTLEETLDTGGPDAIKAAALILRMAATTPTPAPPNRLELALQDDDELLAAGILTPPEE
ncbi:MAG: hypothetical protein KF891_24740 [Rhizobacter sp.]|nr:hypothetical protein [Rhizobacter sp.]